MRRFHPYRRCIPALRRFLRSSSLPSPRKDYSARETLAESPAALLHRLLNFVGGELIKRSRAQIFDLDGVVPFFGLRVDGDIFLQVAP